MATTSIRSFSSYAGGFISEDNLCGETLLHLVGRGHAIIAKLLKESEEIPPAFLLAAETADGTNPDGGSDGGNSSSGGGLWSFFGVNQGTESNRQREQASQPSTPGGDGPAQGDESTTALDENRYTPLLFDFSYLRDPEDCEARLNASVQEADELEASFSTTHSDALAKVCRVFEEIFQYQCDLNKFATDLAKGYYIQYTVESVLLDVVGRQLLCEGVYLYGMMLILMERYFQGPVRERLVIAFLRYCGKDDNFTRMEEICKLCRSTGRQLYRSQLSRREGNKSPGMEDKLFARFPLSEELVRNVIGCLMSDDIFLQSPSFPQFEFRSTRLWKQASMLYVILFFLPAVLEEEMGTMREIVDKHFSDNWVISLYDGMTVDLSEDWARFSAARAALENVLLATNVKRLHVENAKLMGKCTGEVRRYLTSGLMTDRYVLDNTNELLNCLRRCAVSVRWRLLHRRVSNKKFSSIICATDDELDFPVLETHVVTMLLLSSKFELTLKETFSRLLQTKSETWIECRSQAVERMNELSNYFEGDQALSTTRHEGLVKWFSGMAEEINLLNYDTKEEHSTVTGRKIQLCVQALDDVEQFDLIDREHQVKTVLKETKDLLLQMVRAVSIKDDICGTLDCITDMSYGRDVMGSYVPAIHERVKKDPSAVALLRSLFLKLSSFLHWPTARLEQSKSPDLQCVTEYYSSSIVAFVRQVLDIIPLSVFNILTQIVEIKERKLILLPLKIEVDTLHEYSQPEERYRLARLTHELSIFTEGILSMEKTLIGEIEVNPRGLLEDGIRKELVRQVSVALHQSLQFPLVSDTDSTALMEFASSVVRILTKLSSRMEGFRGSIEYIQDYIGIAGLSMWVQELSRIIGYNVEQESNKYSQKKILDTESKFQSHVAPVTRFPRTKTEPTCVNFMGRVVSALLKMSDVLSTVYSPNCSSWCLPDGSEVCGVKTVVVIRKSLGISGLSGIDQLLSFRILNEFHRFFKFYRTTVKQNGVLLEQTRDGLFPEWKTPDEAMQFYASAAKKTEKLMVPMMTCLCRVGQSQLLRKMIRTEILLCSQVNSVQLFQSASLLNDQVLSRALAAAGASTNESHVFSGNAVEVMDYLSDFATAIGAGDPIETVFLATDPLEGLPVLLLLFVISLTPKFVYNPKFGALVRAKEAYPIDGWPVVAGMMTLLKQFHPSYAKSFLSYLGQFVRAGIQNYASQRQQKKEDTAQFPPELKNALIFARQLCSISSIPQSALHEYIPQYLAEMVCLDA